MLGLALFSVTTLSSLFPGRTMSLVVAIRRWTLWSSWPPRSKCHSRTTRTERTLNRWEMPQLLGKLSPTHQTPENFQTCSLSPRSPSKASGHRRTTLSNTINKVHCTLPKMSMITVGKRNNFQKFYLPCDESKSLLFISTSFSNFIVNTILIFVTISWLIN